MIPLQPQPRVQRIQEIGLPLREAKIPFYVTPNSREKAFHSATVYHALPIDRLSKGCPGPLGRRPPRRPTRTGGVGRDAVVGRERSLVLVARSRLDLALIERRGAKDPANTQGTALDANRRRREPSRPKQQLPNAVFWLRRAAP